MTGSTLWEGSLATSLIKTYGWATHRASPTRCPGDPGPGHTRGAEPHPGGGRRARPGGKGRWAWSTRAIPHGAVSLPEARQGPSRTHRSPERGSTSLSQARKQSSERFKPVQRRHRLGAHSWACAPLRPHLSHPHAAISGGVLLRGCPVWSGSVARTRGRASGLVKPRADRAGLRHTGSWLQLGLGQGAQGCWWVCLGAWSTGRSERASGMRPRSPAHLRLL